MKAIVRFLFGYGVQTPSCIPPGATRWRWSILDQIWVPTGEPDFHKPNSESARSRPPARTAQQGRKGEG